MSSFYPINRPNFITLIHYLISLSNEFLIFLVSSKKKGAAKLSFFVKRFKTLVKLVTIKVTKTSPKLFLVFQLFSKG